MPLRDHQISAVNNALPILKEYRIVMLSMEVRTGKTLTSMDIAHRYGATSVLFITKKKAINSVACDYSDFKKITGRTPGFDIEIINYASVHKVEGKYDLVIIDECHSLGAFPKPGVRCERIKKICRKLPIIYLSGTPSPESYSQLFHQLWVSSFSPWRWYKNFYAWSKDYVKVYTKKIKGYDLRQYDRAIKEKIDRDVSHLIVSVTQEEAGFQSAVSEQFIEIPTPPVIKNMMKDLEDEWITFYKGYNIPCNGGGDLIGKLSQLAGGTIIPAELEDGIVISDFKARCIKEKFGDKKLAILYRFRAEKEILTRTFPDYTESPEEFNASASKTFICQIQSAREGVDLQTADALIMYNIDFSATSYFQGRARLQSRDRSDNTPLYWIISDSGFEKKVYKALQRKKNFTWSYYKKEERRKKRKQTAGAQLTIDEMLNYSKQSL